MYLPKQTATLQHFYDDAGQLTKVVDSAGNVVEYVYDPAGNIVQVNRTTVAPGGWRGGPRAHSMASRQCG
jgi:YD repeat-containing protein